MSIDWIGLVAALAAAAGAVFAGLELRHSRLDRQEARAAYRNGVAVTWRPLERPNHPEASGAARWVYEVTAHNPGLLPALDVVVELMFPTTVRRLHYDGALDEPTRTLTLRLPVLLGQGTRTWERSVVLSFNDRHLLASTTATIKFTPSDGPRQTNYMDGRPPVLESA